MRTPGSVVAARPGAGRFALALALWCAAGLANPTDPAPERGAYLAQVAGCVFCHTDTEGEGPPLAGGRRIETDFGVFYTPNITPDQATGIGSWSEQDFVRSLREGIGPGGMHHYPVFPYPTYTRMTDEDILAIRTYLLAQPAVQRASREHELPWYFSWRPLLWVWKLLYLEPGVLPEEPGRGAVWNRGDYVANALCHCAECHTPRSLLGGLDPDLLYAGTSSGPEGEVVPNITPDRRTGIGRWDPDELVDLLESGAQPDGDYVGGAMADVVDAMTSQLDPEDLKALVTYLRALPPIEHDVRGKDRRQ